MRKIAGEAVTETDVWVFAVSLHWAWAVQQSAPVVKVTPFLVWSLYVLLAQKELSLDPALLGAPQQTVSLHLQHTSLAHVDPEQDVVLALAINSWVAGQV